MEVCLTGCSTFSPEPGRDGASPSLSLGEQTHCCGISSGQGRGGGGLASSISPHRERGRSSGSLPGGQTLALTGQFPGGREGRYRGCGVTAGREGRARDRLGDTPGLGGRFP